MNTTQNEQLEDIAKEAGKQPYFKRTELEGTPLTAVETEKGNFIALGMNKITTETLDYQEWTDIQVRCLRIDWEILVPVLATLTEAIVKTMKGEKE